jgi:hypothetical protein
MTKKYAMVNKETEIIENVIVCEETDKVEGYHLVLMPETFYSYRGLYKMDYDIQIGETKWNSEKGFYSDTIQDIVTYSRMR